MNEDIGIEPLYEGEISIKNWLEEDEDNIIVYVPENDIDIPFCLKKMYYTQPRVEQILVECIYENNNLLNEVSYEGDEYINIGYYLGKKYKYIVNKKLLQKILKGNKKRIFTISETEESSKYIVKESLLLSTIGISKFNKKLKYKNIDAYFDDLYIKSLYNYSYQWDGMINRYLINGDSAFETDWFKGYYKRFGSDINNAIENIKQRITNIDKCFLNFAPRNNISGRVLYRGMKTPYTDNMKEGDSFEIKNYISVSKYYHVAWDFSNKKDCCMYIFNVQRGIPYIDMISSSKYTAESEILLPRNLIATCTKVEELHGMKRYTLDISVKDKNQFYMPDSCYTFKNVTIETVKDLKIKIQPQKVMSPSKKICKPDEILNPVSKKCVKRSGKIGKQILKEQGTPKAPSPKAKAPSSPKAKAPSSPKKKCKPDEILNPVSKKCVKRSGKIGKKILKEQGTPKAPSPKAKAPSSPKKKCKPDEILNPVSNRCVKRTGEIGKKLLKSQT